MVREASEVGGVFSSLVIIAGVGCLRLALVGVGDDFLK